MPAKTYLILSKEKENEDLMGAYTAKVLGRGGKIREIPYTFRVTTNLPPSLLPSYSKKKNKKKNNIVWSGSSPVFAGKVVEGSGVLVW